jgi:addiction module HigA family antidote
MDTLKMKNPPHPGFLVRADCLEPSGLTVKKVAELLGVSRSALNNLVNEKSDLSIDMSIRLAKAFGGTPEGWMRLQLQYDMSTINERAKEIKVSPVFFESTGEDVYAKVA